MRRRDIANERVEDATQHLKVGDKVEAKFIGMDRKGRTLQLSIKAKDEAEAAGRAGRVQQSQSDASSGTTKLGALLREQLNGQQVRVSGGIAARRAGAGPPPVRNARLSDHDPTTDTS